MLLQLAVGTFIQHIAPGELSETAAVQIIHQPGQSRLELWPDPGGAQINPAIRRVAPLRRENAPANAFAGFQNNKVSVGGQGLFQPPGEIQAAEARANNNDVIRHV